MCTAGDPACELVIQAYEAEKLSEQALKGNLRAGLDQAETFDAFSRNNLTRQRRRPSLPGTLLRKTALLRQGRNKPEGKAEMEEEALDTFWSLIEKIDVCMMTTRDRGMLRTRPMLPDIDKSTREFRFLTRFSTHKTEELAASPDVNLAFGHPEAGHYVSVSGQAYLTQDHNLIDQLWSAEAGAYFGCSKDDPDIAVIRVVPSVAEYWDAKSTLVQTWNIFKAKLAEPEPNLARHRRFALR